MAKKAEKWYTIEKGNEEWIVWLNTFTTNGLKGRGGCERIFKGTKKECIQYCTDNKIKVSKGR